MVYLLEYLRPRWRRFLKALCLYGLVPALLLWLLAGPVAGAARSGNAAAFLVLLAALGAVGLNWYVYTLLRKTRPSLLVFAHGVLILLIVTLIEYESLPASGSLASTLSVIAGCLVLLYLFLFSFWLADRASRVAHVFAVGMWIVIGLIAFFMLYQVLRDFEVRQVTRDTWITLVLLSALIPAAFIKKILASRRRSSARRRRTGLAEGKILQLIGETDVYREDDPVTDYHARVGYAVNGVDYETRADISKYAMRWFGRKAFVGQSVQVQYDPDNPADAFVKRIDRHFFDAPADDESEN